MQALKDELAFTKAKLEQSQRQARSVCEAWKKEAEECKARAQAAEQEHNTVLAEKQRVRVHGGGNVTALTAFLA